MPNTLPSCFDTLNWAVPDNCSMVCTDVESIMSATDNMLTCGLFASTTYFVEYVNSSDPKTLDGGDLKGEYLLEPFARYSLDYNNLSYVASVRTAVSQALFNLQRQTRIGSYQEGSSLEGSCSEQSLYPISTWDDTTSISINITTSLLNCIHNVCAPLNLDPDLGGIGVIRLMQYCSSYANVWNRSLCL